MPDITQPPKDDGSKKALLRLAALIPIAMAKGGQSAVSGLIGGYQQAQARKQQMGMQQSQQDFSQQMQLGQAQRMDAQEGRLQASADQQAEQQRMEQRRKFLELATGNPEADEGEAMQRLEMLTRQAPSFGVSQLDVEQAAYVAPTRREKAQITKMLADVDKMYPATPERENLKLANGMTVGEARQKLTNTTGAAPIVKPPTNAVNAGSFEDFASETDPARRAKLLADRKAYMQSDDRPRVTVNTGTSDARTNARVDRVVTSFNSHPIVKEFNEVQAQHGIIKSIVESPWSGPGDMAAIFAFMKALDPNSVVRETEYANASRSGNIFQGWAARFNGALSASGGFLSDRLRRDFLRTIESRLSIKSQQYTNLRGQMVKRVDRIKSGAPETGDEALIDYASATAPDGKTTAAPSGGASYQDYLKAKGR